MQAVVYDRNNPQSGHNLTLTSYNLGVILTV